MSYFSKFCKGNVFVFSFGLLLSFSGFASFNVENEFETLSENYPNAVHYSKSIKNSLTQLISIIEPNSKHQGTQKLGVIFGENHNSPGTTYFEILALTYLKSTGLFETLLVEFSPSTFDTLLKNPSIEDPKHQWYLPLQKVRNAESLGFKVIPVDPELTTYPRTPKEKLEAVFNSERENSFMKNIETLDRNFIFFTGHYHSSFFFHKDKLSKSYNLMYAYCTSIESPEKIESTLNAISTLGCRTGTAERYNQHCTFLEAVVNNETSNVLHTPITINFSLNGDTFLELHNSRQIVISEIPPNYIESLMGE